MLAVLKKDVFKKGEEGKVSHWVRQAPNCTETLLLQHIQNLLASFGYLSNPFRLSLNYILVERSH